MIGRSIPTIWSRNRLVDFVLRDDNRCGYIIRDGYKFDQTTLRLSPINGNFDKACGSSAILYFSPSDLPDEANDPKEYKCDKFLNHTTFLADSHRLGRPFDPIPFPGAVYLFNNGENHSIRSGNVKTTRGLTMSVMLKRVANTVVASRRISTAIRMEFGL